VEFIISFWGGYGVSTCSCLVSSRKTAYKSQTLKVLNSTKKKPSRSQRYGRSFLVCFAGFQLQQATVSPPTAARYGVFSKFINQFSRLTLFYP